MQWHLIDMVSYYVSQLYKCIALHVLDWQVTMATYRITWILISLYSWEKQEEMWAKSIMSIFYLKPWLTTLTLVVSSSENGDNAYMKGIFTMNILIERIWRMLFPTFILSIATGFAPGSLPCVMANWHPVLWSIPIWKMQMESWILMLDRVKAVWLHSTLLHLLFGNTLPTHMVLLGKLFDQVTWTYWDAAFTNHLFRWMPRTRIWRLVEINRELEVDIDYTVKSSFFVFCIDYKYIHFACMHATRNAHDAWITKNRKYRDGQQHHH